MEASQAARVQLNEILTRSDDPDGEAPMDTERNLLFVFPIAEKPVDLKDEPSQARSSK